MYVNFITVRLLWQLLEHDYMPSCPVHVSFSIACIIVFLNEINGDGGGQPLPHPEGAGSHSSPIWGFHFI